MKYIVCFSGGHASALTAIEAVRRYGKESVILLNHNISSHVEHADIKRFKQDVADYLDLPITYANADNYEEMTPLKVCLEQKTFCAGRPGQTLCTYYLKTKPFYDWLDMNHPSSFEEPSKNLKIMYGFGPDEKVRIQRRASILGAKGYFTDYPLAYWDRTVEKTEDVGIPRPIVYKVYKHANCVGCLKARQQHWYCVYCLRTDIWEEAKEAESTLGRSIIQDVYLEELEPKFREMRDVKGICPSQKMKPATFWAEVRRRIPGEPSMLPCDCSF